MIIIGRPINGVTVNGLEYILDDNGEPMKFEGREHALWYLLKVMKYTNQIIEDKGIQFIYTNERKECDCLRCEKRMSCEMTGKMQRLPPETTRGLGLGLCPKLQEV